MKHARTPIIGVNPGADRMIFNEKDGTYRQKGDDSGTRYVWNKWAMRYDPATPAMRYARLAVPFKNLTAAAKRGEVKPEQAEAAVKAVADPVHMPPHYKQFTWEPMRVAMENKLNPLQFNVIKYTHRYALKNGIEDLRKAARSLEMLIKFEQGDEGWWR